MGHTDEMAFVWKSRCGGAMWCNFHSTLMHLSLVPCLVSTLCRPVFLFNVLQTQVKCINSWSFQFNSMMGRQRLRSFCVQLNFCSITSNNGLIAIHKVQMEDEWNAKIESERKLNLPWCILDVRIEMKRHLSY